jgi:hypothetical protein
MLTGSRLLVLALASALLSSACIGSGHSVNAYGGTRFLDANDWDDLDNPTVYGLDAVLKVDLPFLAVEGGWFHSDEEDMTVGELEVDEYFVGLRATPWHFLIEPYGSIGATYVNTGLDTGVADDGDDALAYYARVGAAFTAGIVRLGLDGRATFGSDVELDTIESDVDGYQLAAFVGLGF